MKVPLSWLRDFVDITISIEELAYRLTMAGLEVEEILYVGLPMPGSASSRWSSGHIRKADTKITGIEWERDKTVVAEVTEVMPHPNADRLVLCRINDGTQEQVVLTGAPNLFPYKGIGLLEKPLRVAYAREGARIYDGHQPGQVLTTLKRAKIRGFESYSMICSEKELGISDDHEGVIILDDDAPVGVPLADYMGDAVLDISILPNTARAANILGVAREVAALTGRPLRATKDEGRTTDDGTRSTLRAPRSAHCITDLVSIEITDPVLNPRFVLGLIENVKFGPSPYWVQRRLKLAGMRPINNIVDATNYAMLEIGEPLHAFDYDVLVKRAVGQNDILPHITIITRTAKRGEKLATLDGIERELDEQTVLVCDTAGALSIAGVMGGAESEISEKTTSVLLEGAAWHFTNIRRTVRAQNLPSEASFRFSRGVHPALAERGVRRGLELMQHLAGGKIAPGLVDNYPLPPKDAVVEVTPQDVKRWLGLELTVEEMREVLEALEFRCQLVADHCLLVTAPDHRLDIGEGIIGKADLMEEIARIYGYDRIHETRLADELPPQRSNRSLEREERVRDLLAGMGLQEVVTYRLTSPEREAHRLPPDSPADDKPYIRLVNPIASDRVVLRHSLLASVLEVVERNARIRARMALFEIAPIFLASEGRNLPDELQRLVIILTGPRALPGWQPADTAPMDFYDLKGVLAALLEGLHIGDVRYESGKNPTFHPGKCARVMAGDRQLGLFGELHPLVRERYEFSPTPILAAEFDLEALLALVPERYEARPVPEYPPVFEDLALVVDEALPAERVAEIIRQAGGRVVADVRLFDVYRDERIGMDKKSLAYRITYQAYDCTLTDEDVAEIRQRIIHRLEQELGAALRS